VNEEFDLDLTYITERIIAMSFPATGMESAYRNSLKDVAKMLKTKHQESYMIFNLSERSYDISRFNNQVLDFGWPDHLAPSLERLSTVCRSMKSWLDSDPQHVVVVHCKGGKGRTGCVIAAFMNYSEICQSAEAALDRFAMKRFYDSKCVGVTQPSQRKYVHYFSDLLAGRISLKTPPVVLNHVIIHGIPNFDGKGGCRAFLKIYVNMKLEHTSGLHVTNEGDERIKITLHGGGLNLQGEVLLKCFHKKSHSGVDAVFRCQFHTAIVRDTLRLVLKKEDLDDAFNNKKFPEGAKVEMLFERDRQKGADEEVDLRTSLLESNGVTTPTDLPKHEPLSKRDSYANFEGGYDSGTPDKVPDLIQFSPTDPHSVKKTLPPTKQSAGQHRNRTESTDSFNMDPQAIERFAQPGSDHIYTVVNKSAPKVGRISQTTPQGPSSTVLRVREGKADPPYVNQSSIPTNSTGDRPVLYKKSPIQVKQTSQGRPGSQAITVNEATLKATLPQPAAETPSNRKPTYDEISLDQQMRLQPVTPRYIGHDSDSGWCKFKFQTLPSKGDTGHRSSSSSNPTLGSNCGDMYSNLGDLFVGGAFVRESQRRHSFTEGDERIVVRGAEPRDSIIQVGGAKSDPDYNNVSPDVLSSSTNGRSCLATVTGQEEALYTNPHGVVAALNLCGVKGDKREPFGSYYNVAMPGQKTIRGRGKSVVPLPKAGGVVPPLLSGAMLESEDYMNEGSEGMFHTYSNHKELLEQLQAGNNPIPEPALQCSESAGGEKKLSAIFKNFIAKTPFLKKSPSEIHSQTITETDRQKTLQPFALSGPAQPGRDYEAFFKVSAWGSAEENMLSNKQGAHKSHKPSTEDKPDTNKPDVKLKRLDRQCVKPEKPRNHDIARFRAENSDMAKEASGDGMLSQGVQVMSLEETAQPSQHVRTPPPAFSPVQCGHASDVPSGQPQSSHIPLNVELSIPTPHSNRTPLGGDPPPSSSHRKLGTVQSVEKSSHIGDRHNQTPTSHISRYPSSEVTDMDGVARAGGVTRNRQPPTKPSPYIPQLGENQRVPSDSKVRSLMAYWYRPNITREEAIDLVRLTDSGAFIVRDSQTVAGGYALTIKVTPAIVRQRKKLAEGTKVTEDMCVTHFLIQPDPEGVKLQGWNERAFKSLAEFIAHHTVDKLCLPCKLVLPKTGAEGIRGRGMGTTRRDGSTSRGGGSEGIEGVVEVGVGEKGEGGAVLHLRRRPVTMQEALRTGAACDLIYLGSVDVTGPVSEVTLAETVQQRKSLNISVSVVTFKASKEGVTISDNING
jgi:tensin